MSSYPILKNLDESREIALLNRVMDFCGEEIMRARVDILKVYFKDYIKYFNAKDVVIIAGTNGKGETSTCFSELLSTHDISHGLWTSPHVFSVRERLSFNGVCISHEEFDELIDFAINFCESQKISLSFYEFLFLLFMEQAKRLNVKTLVLEVGLGGRLDATNIFSPKLFGLTSISRDHVEYLGPKLTDILNEKLGVTRKGGVLLSTVEQKYLRQNIQEHAKAHQYLWSDLFDTKTVTKTMSFSQRNQLLAIELFSKLTKNQSTDLKFSNQRGRTQKYYYGVHDLTLIGSHNPDGVRGLLKKLFIEKERFDYSIVSFSSRDDADIKSMISAFLNYPCVTSELYFCTEPHFKKVSPEKIRPILDEFPGVKKLEKLKDFLDQQDQKKKVLITGSYYFLGECQNKLKIQEGQ